ncbi:hypothetical protein DBR32_12135 [Taibaiella sp. KBW10]|nr:hypothetical protein DBR32_12135 [Taibaiella sp. KBW10]
MGKVREYLKNNNESAACTLLETAGTQLNGFEKQYYGQLLFSGKGVQHNIPKAITILKEAAHLGFGAAMIELGDWHYNGTGKFAPNIDSAAYWYFKAFSVGYKNNLMYTLGNLFQDKNYCNHNIDNAILWYSLSINSNEARSALAAEKLGDIYNSNVDIVMYPDKAKGYYSISYERRNESGCLKMKKISGAANKKDLENVDNDILKNLQTIHGD